MDFWQYATVVFMLLAFAISLSEAYQVLLQRKLLAKILARIEPFDMDGALDRTEAATRESLAALQTALIAELSPLREKALALDAECILNSAIERFTEKIDARAFAEVAAEVMLERARENIPQMVAQAKESVVEGTPGAPQALALLEGMDENPLMAAIFAAAATRPAPQAQPGQVNAGAGKRVI